MRAILGVAGVATCAAFVRVPLAPARSLGDRHAALTTASRRCPAVRCAMASEEFPDTEITRTFGSLRGKAVKPVSQTIQEFNLLFTKPILHAYRTITNELLQNTHLTVVDARFKYDPIFGYGFVKVYSNFMRSYPGADKEEMFPAMAKALGLDSNQMEKDAKMVAEWAAGKSEADILKVLKGDADGGPLQPVFSAVRENKFFLYNRLWGIGVFSIMEKAGVEPSQEAVQRWMETLGLGAITKAKLDLDQYTVNMDKIAQAEQMFKEIEIREKKKMAERLEYKAKKALEAAEKAEMRAAEMAAATEAAEAAEAVESAVEIEAA